jgi:hypothetical protein
MVGLVCPRCGSPTPLTPLYLSGDRILNYVDGTKSAPYDKKTVQALMQDWYKGVKYAILQCQNCDQCFVVQCLIQKQNEWSSVYPIPTKIVSEEIPASIKDEFEEAYLCFAVGASRASVAMCQRTLESLWRENKASGLNDLLNKGIISKSLFDRATEIRLWAGVTKHAPFTQEVNKDDAEQLLTYLELILNEVYVETKRLEKLRKKREGIEQAEQQGKIDSS